MSDNRPLNLLETTFRTISVRIDQLCRRINPSGSNGRLPELLEAMQKVFSDLGVNESAYWEDVRVRKARNIR
jgi:hypothetical protein